MSVQTSPGSGVPVSVTFAPDWVSECGSCPWVSRSSVTEPETLIEEKKSNSQKPWTITSELRPMLTA